MNCRFTTLCAVVVVTAACSRNVPSRRVAYYYDPMHPAYRSDKPGIAPDCNMALVPRYTDEQPTDNAIHLTAAQERLSGIATTEAVEQEGRREIRVPGRVVAADSLRYKISAGADGLIGVVHGGSVGSLVRKNEVLGSYISRDVSTPQQAYIYALDAVDRVRRAAVHTDDQLAPALRQADVARDTLRQLGMNDGDIADLERTRSELRELRFLAPVDGIVTARNASPGMRFAKGDQLFEIASIDRLWVEASVFASDIGALTNSTGAAILTPDGTQIAARTLRDEARFEPDTEPGASLASVVRLELTNTAHRLVPGMYVGVVFDVRAPRALVLPSESVVETGSGARVFVRRSDGAFEARRIRTGWRMGGYVQVTDGLHVHDVVARSGVFLLDSETQIKDGGVLP